MTNSKFLGLPAGMHLGKLRQRTTQSPYKELWKRLRSRTREVVDAARRGGFKELSYGSLAWHSNIPMAPEAALIGVLDEDEDFLHYVDECVDVVAMAHEAPSQYDTVLHGRPPVNAHGDLALATDICRGSLSSATRETLLGLMREQLIDCHQGAAAYTGYSGGGNVSLCRVINAAFCAVCWGAEAEHPGWREVVDHAVTHIRCYLKYGCDAGGFGYEGTGYSHEVFHYIFALAQIFKQNGTLDLFSSEPRLRQVLEASLQLSFPGAGQLHNANDHGLLMPRSMEWLLFAAKHYADPLLLGLWSAYQGPDHPNRPYGDVMPWYRENYLPGSVPIDQSLAMLTAFLHWDADAPHTEITGAGRDLQVYSPGTEHVVMRTSWSDDAVAVYLPGSGRSHASQTHRHADCGHFSIFACGEYLAIDTGRYNVDEDQHSVVLVDGKCHQPNNGWGMSTLAGRKSVFQTGHLCTYVCADAAAMKACCWADRHFLFVPIGEDDAYLVVLDNLNKDNQRRLYRWQLQANPTCKLNIGADHTATVNGARARLDLTFVIPEPSDFPDAPHALQLHADEKEWAWPYGHNKTTEHNKTDLMITSFRRPRLLADVTGNNGQLLTVIVPRREDQAPLQIDRVPSQRLLQVHVHHPLGSDHIIAALDHGCIRTDAVNGLTQLALIRRDKNGNCIAQWTADGAPLEVE